MKAAYIEKFGGPEVLQYGDLPDPVAGPGEVVVDVHAATVNAADWKFRAGEYARHSNVKFPQIPGRDFSGVVGAVGDGADLKVGDAVFGVLGAGKEGTYCEKIAIPAALVAKKPEGLSHINAAALALTGLTAINSVEDTLKLQRGETILIQGGAGGVAGFAIQFAKYLGARVITTCSAANVDYVRSLGADEVIDYNAQISPAWCPAATPCSIRSAAMWQNNPLPCSSRAAAPPLSPQAPSRRSPIAATSPRCGRRCRARARRWSALPSSMSPAPSSRPRSSSTSCRKPPRRTA